MWEWPTQESLFKHVTYTCQLNGHFQAEGELSGCLLEFRGVTGGKILCD